MLHTRFQGHRPFGSGEDFWRGFTIYGRGGHLGHVTQVPRRNFRSRNLGRLHMNYGFNRPSGCRGDVWKCWRSDGQTTDACLYYKFTYEPKGSGELKPYVPASSGTNNLVKKTDRDNPVPELALETFARDSPPAKTAIIAPTAIWIL